MILSEFTEYIRRERGNEAAREFLDRVMARINEIELPAVGQRTAHEAEIEASLEPQKVKLCRQWLVDHPGETEKSFEMKAWPLLRANLLDDRRAIEEAEIRESLLKSGRYVAL